MDQDNRKNETMGEAYERLVRAPDDDPDVLLAEQLCSVVLQFCRVYKLQPITFAFGIASALSGIASPPVRLAIMGCMAEVVNCGILGKVGPTGDEQPTQAEPLDGQG